MQGNYFGAEEVVAWRDVGGDFYVDWEGGLSIMGAVVLWKGDGNYLDHSSSPCL